MDATGNRQISRLIAQYFQLLDLRNLSIPLSTVLKPAEIQNRIFTELFDEAHLAPVIPPASYRLKVLKKLITTIENDPDWDPEEDEIIEPLLMAMMSLMSQPSEKNMSSGLDGEEPELSYVSYTLPQMEEQEVGTGKDKRQVTTFESRGLIYGSGSTGFRTWEAALHLGTYLCSITSSSPVSIRGKKVIELGAGTGFISLLCQKFLGAEKVLMTDGTAKLIDVFNGPCLEQNGLGGASQRIKGKQWTWGEPMSVDGTEERFDIALGADLTYDIAIIPLLVDSISHLFTEHGIETFVISATIRNQDTFDVFLDACRSRRFNLQKSDFESPALEHQTGFFHSSQVPILIYLISPP